MLPHSHNDTVLCTDSNSNRLTLSLLVPKSFVKLVKDALKSVKSLDPNIRIVRSSQSNDFFWIPSLIPIYSDGKILDKFHDNPCLWCKSSCILWETLQSFPISQSALDKVFSLRLIFSPLDNFIKPIPTRTSPLITCLQSYLQTSPEASSLPELHSNLSTLSIHYTLFTHQLLLLPPNFFTLEFWNYFPTSLKQTCHLQTFYAELVRTFNVTHLAISGSIEHAYEERATQYDLGNLIGISRKNVSRLPCNFVPLFGSFGPEHNHTQFTKFSLYSDNSVLHHNEHLIKECLYVSKVPFKAAKPFLFPDLSHPTSIECVNETLFVETRQFGVMYIFPPIRCMFSRGNIIERKRLTELVQFISSNPCPSEPFSQESQLNFLFSPIPSLPLPCNAISAVDLFAGIGYFAFCYAKVNISTILTWEVNGWSIEAMQRGIQLNNWTFETYCWVNGCSHNHQRSNENFNSRRNSTNCPHFRIHHAPNITALSTLKELRSKIPPVCHVNCGILPTSRSFWFIALLSIDPVHGGWLHVHECLNIMEEYCDHNLTNSKPETEFSSDSNNLSKRDMKLQKSAAKIFKEISVLWHTLMNTSKAYHNMNNSTKTQDEHFNEMELKVRGTTHKNNVGNIKLVSVNRVKSYAPNIWHCVLDIWVPCRQSR